jgi:predicted nucleic acid-binding protein
VIVVDTNVITYLWVPCAETPLAERLAALDEQWCAPLLWRSEFRNVLVGLARRGLITFEGARRTADDAESQMRDREYAVPSDSVIRMAASGECSAYDCEFVVLAQALGVPLVTADRQVVKAFPSIAHFLSTYANHQ